MHPFKHLSRYPFACNRSIYFRVPVNDALPEGTAGKIKWSVKVGVAVKKGDILASLKIPSRPDYWLAAEKDGKVLQLFFKNNDLVESNDVLCDFEETVQQPQQQPATASDPLNWVDKLSVRELKEKLDLRNLFYGHILEKSELVELLKTWIRAEEEELQEKQKFDSREPEKEKEKNDEQPNEDSNPPFVNSAKSNRTNKSADRKKSSERDAPSTQNTEAEPSQAETARKIIPDAKLSKRLDELEKRIDTLEKLLSSLSGKK
jgi:pyruvate/2-oxoglutarate dehydrogenase complex dihydrolipoamide acyltransferase (E2) component